MKTFASPVCVRPGKTSLNRLAVALAALMAARSVCDWTLSRAAEAEALRAARETSVFAAISPFRLLMVAAATAAALLAGKVVPEPGQTVAAVVSGGNVAPKTAAAILASDEA